MRASQENRRELLDDDDLPLEKNDMAALYIAGLLTVGIPCLLLILLIVAVTLLLFG